MPLLQEAANKYWIFKDKIILNKYILFLSLGITFGLGGCDIQTDNALLSTNATTESKILKLQRALAKKESTQSGAVSIATDTESEKEIFKQISTRFNTALSAEMYYQLGESQQAVSHYMKLVAVSNDAAISKRATQIAATTTQLKKGLETAKRWVVLAPRNLEALQYLALLLLRNNHSDASAKQLFQIYQLIEEDAGKQQAVFQTPIYSKGLKFIGAMLLIEAHHEKALNVFDHFVKSYQKEGLKDKKVPNIYLGQQYLIRASLAKKAKNDKAVLESINNFEKNSWDIDSQKLHEVMLMKITALKNLKRFNEAVHYLKPIIDDKKGSDSLQLELVRMFIIDKQKKKARPYLENLVEKHPDNNDLLKSLIALEIDQKELTKARENIVELKKSPAYDNDAMYFLAEVIEAEGNLEEALNRYQKVKSGPLLNNAKRKVQRLTRMLSAFSKNDNKLKVNYKKQIQKGLIAD